MSEDKIEIYEDDLIDTYDRLVRIEYLAEHIKEIGLETMSLLIQNELFMIHEKLGRCYNIFGNDTPHYGS